MYGKTFSKRLANTLEIIFASTLINEIGRQFLINLLSFPFFSISVIIACFGVFESSPNVVDTVY